MKKKSMLTIGRLAIVTLAIGIISINGVFAAPKKVNYSVINQFNSLFKQAKNVSWKVKDNYIEAQFEINGENKQVFFNNAAEVIGITKNIQLNSLPKIALDGIVKKYQTNRFKVEDAIEYTNSEDEKRYFVSLVSTYYKIIVEVDMEGNISEFKKTVL